MVLLLASGSNLSHGQRKQHALIMEVSALYQEQLNNPSALLVIDVRDPENYLLEHIPGAINLPVELTFNEQGDRNRIASLNQIRKYFSAAGITNNDPVVLYDEGLARDAAHVFWVMETYGHQNIRVLNGGMSAWKQLYPTSSAPTHRPASNYVPFIAPHHLSTKLTTRLAIDNDNVVVLDARDKDEYLGKKSQASRYGHIPGAVNIPWQENLQLRDGVHFIKPIADLQSIYTRVENANNVITYCNRGKESALSYLILRNLGYPASVYDGAWLEWGNDELLPIVTPVNDKHSSDRPGDN